MSGERARVMVVMLAAGTLAAACSDTPLAGLGETTERWITGPTQPVTTTSTAPVVVPAALLGTLPASEVEWVNDGLGGPRATPPDDAIAAVWARSNREDRYVQASRHEIAAALPGLTFPAVVPEDVRYVTSQLVFDPGTGRLGEVVAAFGFWSVEPYTKSRSLGQRAVLYVGMRPEVDTGADMCEELAAGAVISCSAVTVESRFPAWSLSERDGWRLVWDENGYRYDLFVRDAALETLPMEIAASSRGMPDLEAAAQGP